MGYYIETNSVKNKATWVLDNCRGEFLPCPQKT